MDLSFLNEKVVIITGATSGIGWECATMALSNGAKVVFAARQSDIIASKLSRTNYPTENYLICKTDVSIATDCEQMIQDTVAKFGKIDVLVNNAGISMRALFKDVDIHVLRQIMDVNFWGCVYCTKYALPYLLKSKGSIVGVSSVAGFKGLAARTGYSASKFALNGFLETLRIELLKSEVHILVISPGYTASNIRKTALNAMGKPQDETPLEENKLMSPMTVAYEILHGIRRKKRTVILTPLGRWTIFVNKFLPGFVDKMVFRTLKNEVHSPLQ
jgi:short-subunit dehydrogenase